MPWDIPDYKVAGGESILRKAQFSIRLHSVVYKAETEKEGALKVVKAMLANVILLVKVFVPYNTQDIGKAI
jgi:hypothetical protein